MSPTLTTDNSSTKDDASSALVKASGAAPCTQAAETAVADPLVGFACDLARYRDLFEDVLGKYSMVTREDLQIALAEMEGGLRVCAGIGLKRLQATVPPDVLSAFRHDLDQLCVEARAFVDVFLGFPLEVHAAQGYGARFNLAFSGSRRSS